MDLGRCDICGQLRGTLIFSDGRLRCIDNNRCRGNDTADNESPALGNTIQRYHHYRNLGTAPGAMVRTWDKMRPQARIKYAKRMARWDGKEDIRQ